jgi:hypothetical protein
VHGSRSSTTCRSGSARRFRVLPAGAAWRTDHTAAALRASYRHTVAAVGRTSRIQPITAHLPAIHAKLGQEPGDAR